MNADDFKPFEVGTIRGPYICGIGYDCYAGIQYLVRGLNGWAVFITRKNKRDECKKEAEAYAALVIEQQRQQDKGI